MSRKNRDREEENAPEREEEVLTRKEKIAYEKQLVREGKILPRYSPSNPFRRLIALILVFFFGLFAAIGGIIGTFVYLGTRPLKEGFHLFNLDYSQFLTDEAANKSVLDFAQVLKDYQSLNTLGTIGEYTTLVDTMLNGLDAQVSALGIHLDVEEFKATPFSQIGSYLQESVLKKIVLGEALGLKPSDNALLVTLCYGEEGVDYEVIAEEDGGAQKFAMLGDSTPLTIADFMGGAMSDLLGKITIEAALGVTAESDTAIRYLAYGSEGKNYAIHTDGEGNKSVVMLTDPQTNESYKKKTLASLTAADANLLGNAKISDLIEIEDGAKGILGAVRDWKISDLSDSYRIERIKISQILDTQNATDLGKKLADWYVGDLTNGGKFDALVLSDVIKIDENSPLILQTLADIPLGDCGAVVNKMHLSDILGDLSNNKLLSKLQNSTLQTLNSDIQNFTVADLFGDEIYSFMTVTTDDEGNRLTYAKIVHDYEEGHKTEAGSQKDLNPYVLAQEQTENLRHFYRYGSIEVQYGVFEKTAAGNFILLENPKVYSENGALHVERALILTPCYEWSLVNYAEQRLDPLPEGDRVEARTDLPTDSDLPHYLENGVPLCYVSGENEYPLYFDEYSVYYLSAERERVDLDCKIIAYATPDGQSLAYADGKVIYQETECYVRTQKAVGEEGEEGYEPAYNYIVINIPVAEYYYRNTDGAFTAENLYTADEVTEHWELETADGAIEVERFLDGVWYLLFGGEVRDENEESATYGQLILDENGNIQIIDNADTPLLDVAALITGITVKLNDTRLWQLYLHGMLNSNANPYTVLPDGSNLNELTITGCIREMQKLTQQIGQLPASN